MFFEIFINQYESSWYKDQHFRFYILGIISEKYFFHCLLNYLDLMNVKVTDPATLDIVGHL